MKLIQTVKGSRFPLTPDRSKIHIVITDRSKTPRHRKKAELSSAHNPKSEHRNKTVLRLKPTMYSAMKENKKDGENTPLLAENAQEVESAGTGSKGKPSETRKKNSRCLVYPATHELLSLLSLISHLFKGMKGQHKGTKKHRKTVPNSSRVFKPVECLGCFVYSQKWPVPSPS